MKGFVRLVVFVSLFASAATAGWAQEQREPGQDARFRWGALRFTPGIALTDMGVDNNVFNDADHELSDTTAAIGPAVNFWMNAGSLRMIGKSAGQYLYFQKYDNQRAWNTADELRFEFPLSRFKPFAVGSYANTKQRPGFEIDSRARASTNAVTLGTDLRFSGKTMATLSGTRAGIAFDEKETFLGSELAAALNRHSDTETAQLKYALTPLTTLVMTADAVQDRFDHDRLRNADSFSVRPGFEFKPFALISGKVSVGIRHFNALNDSVRDFQGAVATVDVKYTLTTSTQLTAKVNRDVAFSFEETEPYYTLTDSGLTLTQRVASSWDVLARSGWQSLAYNGIRTDLGASERTDRGQLYGLGIGYRLGETLRLGLDVNYYFRRSALTNRNYDGLRAGVSVSYGISQ